jgi:two-component system sensor histidine kinase VicK
LSELLAKNTHAYQDAHVSELIEVIHRMAAGGVHLIREFIKQEFLESAQVTLLKNRVDLVERLHLLIGQYQQSQLQLAKTFTLEASSPAIFVSLDQDKFLQVVNNLVSNAIKFTPDEGHIRVCLEEKDQTVLLTVTDDGIGIPPAMQEGLFDKFTKARRPGIRGEESVGLGMSIIKTIVKWHGGNIWFKSQEHKGTTFYVEIPKE